MITSACWVLSRHFVLMWSWSNPSAWSLPDRAPAVASGVPQLMGGVSQARAWSGEGKSSMWVWNTKLERKGRGRERQVRERKGLYDREAWGRGPKPLLSLRATHQMSHEAWLTECPEPVKTGDWNTRQIPRRHVRAAGPSPKTPPCLSPRASFTGDTYFSILHPHSSHNSFHRYCMQTLW